MKLSDEQIKQFKLLYQEHFGENISDEQARIEGMKLVHLISIVYRPMTIEQFANALKIQEELTSEMISDNTLPPTGPRGIMAA